MGETTPEICNSAKPDAITSIENHGTHFCRPQILPPVLRISRSDPAISTNLQSLRMLPFRVAIHRSELQNRISEQLPHIDSFLSGVSHHSSDPHGIKQELGKSLSSESSYHSMRCRICFLTSKESEEAFLRTGCHCRGIMQFTHRSCLQKWVDTKGSRQCECCLGTFDLDLSEEGKHRLELQSRMPQNSQVYIQMPDGLRVRRVGRVVRPTMILRTDTSCRNSPRSWLMTSFIIMLLATTCSAALTAYAHKQMVGEDSDITTETPGLTYGLALTFLIFCGALTLSVGCLWVCAELSIWPLGNGLPAVQDVIISDNDSIQDIILPDNNDLPQNLAHV